MAPIRIIDFLHRAEAFHKRLSAYYHELSEHTRRKELRQVLDYMSRHEAYLETCLKAYEVDAPRGVSETWLKPAPDLSILDKVIIDPEPLDMTPDEAIRLAVALDNVLIHIYKQLADTAVSQDLASAMNALIDMERSEERKMVRALQEA